MFPGIALLINYVTRIIEDFTGKNLRMLCAIQIGVEILAIDIFHYCWFDISIFNAIPRTLIEAGLIIMRNHMSFSEIQGR